MNPAVGKKLRQARQRRDISIEDVEKSIHIRDHYLTAMEAGDFDSFPSQAQARGFLRAYAEFLDLDGDVLLEALEKDTLMTLMSAKEGGAESESPEGTPEGEPGEPEPAFKPIGEALKSQRDMLGLSLEDVERHTHLKTHYLQALESGDFDALPSMAQGSGMLKNYAQFLSLDPEPLLLQFADRLQAQWQERREAQPAEKEAKKRKKPKAVTPARRFFTKELLIGGSLVVSLILFALWAGVRIAAMRSQREPEPTVPSIADVLLPSPTEPLAPTPTVTIFAPLEEAEPGQPEEEGAEAAPQEEIIPLGEVGGAVRVQVDVSQRAYMRVTVDDDVVFDGRVAPGDAYTFGGEERIEILSGNGEALYVTYNDVELGRLGLFGEVVNVIITPNGLLTPTPTISPTPTRTPRTTPTSTPTPPN
jgi:cytoskeletal protein RodZ